MNEQRAAGRSRAHDSPAAVAQFRAAVLQSPALQDRLGRHTLPDHFVAECRSIADALGIALSEDAVHDALWSSRRGLDRSAATPVTLDRWPSAGWRPARSVPGDDAPAFDWAWFGDEPLTDPFYADAVRRMGSCPFSLMFRTRTALAAIVAGHAEQGDLLPDGLIFHMSRCGSTLAAQMLAAVPQHVVVSEAEPIDAVVQWAMASGRPLAEQAQALRAIVAAVGRGRTGQGQRYFIKLDSWHARALPLFRAAFPTVPWIFLYREPLEVIASLLRMRGLQAVPGALAPHVLQIADGTVLSSEAYCVAVIERIGSAALDADGLGGGLFVDYAELVPAMLRRVPQHFGFTPDAAEAAAMQDVAGFDAKQPGMPFQSDSIRKRAELSPAAALLVETHLRPLHERLRASR